MPIIIIAILKIKLLHHNTLKQGCQAGIKLKLSVDGQSLVITDLSEDYNHEVDKVSIDVTFFRTLNYRI